MTEIFNKKKFTFRRNQLRKISPRAEQLLWKHLKGRKVHNQKFRRQMGIGRYVVDFYCPELRLAVEIDGGYHCSLDMKEYDPARQTTIEALGIKFLRFTNKEIENDLEKVVSNIKNSLPAYEGGRVGLWVKKT